MLKVVPAIASCQSKFHCQNVHNKIQQISKDRTELLPHTDKFFMQKSPNLEHPENEIQPGASNSKARKNNMEIKVVEVCLLVLVGRKSKQAVTICLRFGDVLNPTRGKTTRSSTLSTNLF